MARTNFVRTLENSQRFIATKRIVHQKKKGGNVKTTGNHCDISTRLCSTQSPAWRQSWSGHSPCSQLKTLIPDSTESRTEHVHKLFYMSIIRCLGATRRTHARHSSIFCNSECKPKLTGIGWNTARWTNNPHTDTWGKRYTWETTWDSGGKAERDSLGN